MKIEIRIVESKDTGKVRCSLQPPKYLVLDKKVSDDIEKTCKIVWIEIDNLLQNLQNIK